MNALQFDDLRRGMRATAVYIDAMRRVGRPEYVKEVETARLYVLAAILAGHPNPAAVAFEVCEERRDGDPDLLPEYTPSVMPPAPVRVWRVVFAAGVTLDVEVQARADGFHARFPGAQFWRRGVTPRRAIRSVIGQGYSFGSDVDVLEGAPLGAYFVVPPAGLDAATELAEVRATVEESYGPNWRKTLAQWLPLEAAP